MRSMYDPKRQMRILLPFLLILFCFMLYMRHDFRVRYHEYYAHNEKLRDMPNGVAPRHIIKTRTPSPTPLPTPPSPSLADILKAQLGCKDVPLQMERIQYGEYWMVRNLVRGTISQNISCAASITYTTHGDYTFMEHVAPLVLRWRAPISFAIYAPGYDMNRTLEAMQMVRNCLSAEESALIREYVTFHVYFPAIHLPPRLPLTEREALAWPYSCDEATEAPPTTPMYRTLHNLTYPINVGRNIARKSTNTHFILASDIELYPSPGVVRRFLEMASGSPSVLKSANGRVFVLPVFEVQANATLPDSKSELLDMLSSREAIPFHSSICKNCHLVPNQTQWLNVTADEGLLPFSMSRREKSFVFWEPFYISDNLEPYFDERVTWEGQKNKRIQGFAMCLLKYEYYVLNDGFLVHSPGIKHFVKNSTRVKNYVPAMNKLINQVIVPEYKIIYGQNKKCKV